MQSVFYHRRHHRQYSRKGGSIREAVKNVLADFVPPTPLTKNHFAKKPLTELGGTPPPPLTENPQKKF